MKPRDEEGRLRVKAFYEKNPLPDEEMAKALGIPRTTVTKFRNELHFPAVGLCTVCKAVIGSRRFLCNEHKKDGARGQSTVEFMADKATGRALIDLARSNPSRYKADLDTLRASTTARKFKVRFGWVEKAVARDRATRRVDKARAKAKAAKEVIAESESHEVRHESPSVPMPAPNRPTAASVFDSDPEPAPLKDKWSEPYHGPATLLKPTVTPQKPVTEQEAFDAHREACEDPECRCRDPDFAPGGQAGMVWAPPPPDTGRPLGPPAPAKAPAPPPPVAQAPQSDDPLPGFVVLRHRRAPPPSVKP